MLNNQEGIFYNGMGDRCYRHDPAAVRRDVAAYMSAALPMREAQVGSNGGQELLRRLESGSVGPLKAEALLSAHVKSRLHDAMESRSAVMEELERMEDNIDPSVAPAFIAVREQFGLRESKALVRRGFKERATKSLEESRKRRVDQRPPPAYAAPSGASAPPPAAAAPAADTATARLVAQLAAAEEARRAAEDARRTAMDQYLAAERERAELEARMQQAAESKLASCACRR